MKIRVIIAFILAGMLFPVLSIAADVVIIANPEVVSSKLSRKDISNIYLGKKTSWDDGRKIVFTIQKSSDLHRIFLKKYIHKSPMQFNNYWQKMVFTGRGSSPKVFDSDQALIKFVSESKGAIGYISTKSDRANVKTISVDW